MKDYIEEFKKYLEWEEKILWEGHPEANIFFTKWDIIYVPMGFFLILALLKTLTLEDILGIQIIILGPIIVLYLFVIFGRFFFKYVNKKRTVYYVTNKRILVYNKSSERIIREIHIHSIKNITKDIHNNRMGTIEFGETPIMQMFGGNTGFDYFETLERFAEKLGKIFYGSGPMVPIFYDIKDAESVYRMVNELRRK
ncbi:MAG: hypothetical protein HPY50_15540 [Firmicutes bacterium]|nr:hypothetical protein [Bacillota bacterium]